MFIYRVIDDDGGLSNISTVTITVKPFINPNILPVAVDVKDTTELNTVKAMVQLG